METPRSVLLGWKQVAWMVATMAAAAVSGCKHTGTATLAASTTAGPLVDEITHRPFDPAQEAYVIWLPYDRSPDEDELQHTDVRVQFERLWVTYTAESFLMYMNGLISAGKGLPEHAGFSAGTPLLVTKKSVVDPLYLKWNPQKKRFDNTDSVQEQTLASFLDAEGDLTAPRKAQLFVVEAATSKASDKALAAYAGEASVNGLRQGPGILVAHDYSVISGNFVQGRLQGHGRLIDANGVIFEGDFANDRLNSDFKVTFPSGNTYRQSYRQDSLTRSTPDQIVDQSKARDEVGYRYGGSLLKYGSPVRPQPARHPLLEAEDATIDAGCCDRSSTNAEGGQSIDTADPSQHDPSSSAPAESAVKGAHGR